MENECLSKLAPNDSVKVISYGCLEYHCFFRLCEACFKFYTSKDKKKEASEILTLTGPPAYSLFFP
jgi:hypothetical protein